MSSLQAEKLHLRKLLVSIFAFTALESWLFLNASATLGQAWGPAWEGWVSLLFFLFGSYHGGRALLLSRPRRVFLGLLVLVAVAMGVAMIFPFRRLEPSLYSLKVYKAKHSLELYRGQELVETFQVALGGSPRGDKMAEGDMRTPEGDFHITDRTPSSFHKWLGLSYPDSGDAWRGRWRGKITWLQLWYLRVQDVNMMIPESHTALGGDIGLHGGGGKKDWTLGCIALENGDIDKLYAVIQPGTPVQILP